MRPIVVVKDVGAEISQQEKQRSWGETLQQTLHQVSGEGGESARGDRKGEEGG